jgi:hypothetical protein
MPKLLECSGEMPKNIPQRARGCHFPIFRRPAFMVEGRKQGYPIHMIVGEDHKYRG